MSTFRIVYRERDGACPPNEEVAASEFLVQDPWIVFLDPSGACLSVRSDRVERIERVTMDPDTFSLVAPRERAPSDPVIPD